MDDVDNDALFRAGMAMVTAAITLDEEAADFLVDDFLGLCGNQPRLAVATAFSQMAGVVKCYAMMAGVDPLTLVRDLATAYELG